MSQAASRLALLIQMLGISGNDLANALDIDPSLISKWKRNRRRIPVRTDTMRKIAGYLLSIDDEQDRNIIRPLLTTLAKDQVLTQDDSIDLLAHWLLETETSSWYPDVNSNTEVRLDQNSYVCPMEVFRGVSGRRKAALRFLDDILNLPADQHLMIMMQEDIAWLEDDPEFRSQFRSKLKKWIETGHQLDIIHWIDRKPESLRSIISEWLPLHLDARVNSWYYPVYGDISFPKSVMVVPGHMALNGSLTDMAPLDYHTILFTDQATVRQCEWFFKKLQRDCIKLVDNYLPAQMDQFIHRFHESWQQLNNQFMSMHSILPFALSLAHNNILKIIDYNQLNTSVTERLLTKWEAYGSVQIPGRPTGSRIRLIHHLESIEKVIKLNEYVDPMLSAFAGHPITVRNQDFRELLQMMSNAIHQDSSYEIALARSDVFQRSAWSNFMVVSGTFLLAWGDNINQNHIFANEATLVHTFDRYFNERWQQIPRISRDRQEVARQLLSIANL